MERLRKYKYSDPRTGREACYVVGGRMCDDAVRICEITSDTDCTGKVMVWIYVENERKESCLWKNIIVTWTNVLELEYDWTKIIGDGENVV